MTQITALLVATLLALTGSAAAQSQEPSQAPQFESHSASPSVVIAISTPGDSYADPNECMQANVICMHYPLWFHAKPLLTLYGSVPESSIRVTTYTHYGQPLPDPPGGARVMLLLRQGQDFLMPTYASASVWRSRDGDYFFLKVGKGSIDWLPCSVASLEEPVPDGQFPLDASVKSDSFWVKENPRAFVVRGSRAWPRVGIRMSRLSEYLKSMRLSTDSFRCPTADES